MHSSKKHNFKLVFDVFKRNYQLVPLEIFAKNPFHSLIATMMSSRTNDDTTVVAAKRLFQIANTPAKILTLEESEIRKLIYPVGFYKTKAKNILQICKILLIEYKGNVPKSREELTKLPGVGRKTANLVLNRAYGMAEIAVDTHVHRISNILGWVDTHSPEKTELELVKIVPKKYWSDINKFMVSIGRQYRSERQLTEFLKREQLI